MHLFTTQVAWSLKAALALTLFSSVPALAQNGATHHGIQQKISSEAALKAAVGNEVQQLMQQQQIPGMAVAVLWQGKTFYYSFGKADISNHIAVTPDTLFELGSISKTFAGVIGAMALQRGDIKLTDSVATHWPALTAKPWQNINMQHLATYTAGGLPMHFPKEVTDEASLLQYYQTWQPAYAPGTQRVYANTSIGLFAHLAVAAGGHKYTDEFSQLTATLQLNSTYLQVPATAQSHYAWGYDEGKPVRIGKGVLWDEAGGVKASVRDVASWVQTNMQPQQVEAPLLKAALVSSQQPYAKAGQMYQGLGWEMLDYPLQLQALEAMTDPGFVSGSPASLMKQPAADTTTGKTVGKTSHWIHKTGATGGFGAYAAFIPSRQVGIVLLSNKRYPNALRVKLAYQILEGLQ
ncbi:class C beta-lactamase [Rheinheimera sp. 4Y26]|uniref:class C beta-lactamase n=1 Tax=Rheinheimera sp. 4Y26 TaxID=2977811 RepID=UPI0021B1148E|nr:class C beta-lactamase [Rheinheimera sp. 4Y26]MCT6698756.1 beta-lactamase [Rheinheimera sp. 4Y26]